MTLLYSRSQHFTWLSSPAEKRYGCRGLTTNPRIALIWPVNVNFNPPSVPAQHFAKSQILIVLSADPVANHSFEGSKAIDRTQPKCPEITALNSHGACQRGVGTFIFVWGLTKAREALPALDYRYYQLANYFKREAVLTFSCWLTNDNAWDLAGPEAPSCSMSLRSSGWLDASFVSNRSRDKRINHKLSQKESTSFRLNISNPKIIKGF